ncbi:MAG: hypothetical protein ABII18_10475 [bacterium]|nr:hypothetical protein [bacterium]MBU1916761.1 hypothetical protein [bacterium]
MAKKKVAKKAANKTTKKVNKMEMLLVGSKTKDALRAMKVNVAGDALEHLNGVVYWYIAQAAKRAQSNGRKTVRGHDFFAG